MNLPFSADHEPDGIQPMGETINHPPPSSPLGHGGIDFQWDRKAAITAVADGSVAEITSSTHQETGIFNWSVSVTTNQFIVNYTTLETVNPDLRVGSNVSAGQFIGYPTPVQKGHDWHMIHWDFGIWKKHKPMTSPEGVTTEYQTARICPIPYFMEPARKRLFQIWESAAYEAKGEFPDLCNGAFKNY
jgi:hypothetical protein